MDIEEMRAALAAAEKEAADKARRDRVALLAGLEVEYGATEIAPMLYELWRQPVAASLAAAMEAGLKPGDWDYRARRVGMRHVLIGQFLYATGGGHVLTQTAAGSSFDRPPLDIGMEAADAIRRGEFPVSIRTPKEQ